MKGDPLYGRTIDQVIAIRDTLWMRLDNGSLVSLRLKDGRRRTVIERGVADMDHRGDRLYLLLSQDDRFWIEALVNNRRRAVAAIPSPDASRSPGVWVSDGGLALVGSAAVSAQGRKTRPAPSIQVYDERSNTWRGVTVRMPADLDDEESPFRRRWVFGGVSADLTRDGSAYYLGVEMGEWSGNLYRIDLADGEMRRIDLGDDNNVTDVQRDPSRSDCVIVATGLEHMVLREGSLRRVCGDRVSPIFQGRDNGEAGFSQGLPIFGLAVRQQGLWLTTNRGLFQTDADGTNQRPITPVYAALGGLMLDKTHKGVVLIEYNATSPSPRRYPPLVVAR